MLDCMDAVWQSVAAENIVRHKSGNYYLQAKVGGKKIRRSLKTTDLKVAKIKRDAMLTPMKAGVSGASDRIKTLGDALLVIEAKELARPNIRPRTKEYYQELFRILKATLPLSRSAIAFSAEDAAAWWSKAGQRSPIQANNLLRFLRMAVAAIRKTGVRHDDPTEDLKRVRGRSADMKKLPSKEDFARIVEDIRGQGKSRSKSAGSFVEFLAWSGCRLGEARTITRADMSDQWLHVHGGEAGTKGGEPRLVPINPRLRAVIDRMGKLPDEGPIFDLKACRDALKNACLRLGLPHMRIHDLRHLFATQAIEAGVDFLTLAKWMGHKDRGILIMKTYRHLRDDHSLESAKKMV